jgi:hypothetical protein
MVVPFPVYPPRDLERLDKQKLGELKLAILQVLHEDPDVKTLLRDKTEEVYQKLLRS